VKENTRYIKENSRWRVDHENNKLTHALFVLGQMPVVNGNANNPYWLTDPDSIKKYSDEMKMKIALAGTGRAQDILNQSIFILVRSKMCGAKLQHTLSNENNEANENKEALMSCLDTTADWAWFERVYFKHYPKNRERTESKQGAKTLLTVGAVVKKVMAATVLAVPKKISDCIYNCRTAQNEMIEQVFIGATKKNTRRSSHDGRSAKRARVAIDMGIDH